MRDRGDLMCTGTRRKVRKKLGEELVDGQPVTGSTGMSSHVRGGTTRRASTEG